MGLTVSFVYNRLNYLDKDGRAAVTVRICVDRKNRYYGPGIHLLPKQWDARNNQVKNHPDSYELNEHLAEIKKKAFSYYREAKMNGEFVTAGNVLDYIKGGGIEETFNEFLGREIERQAEGLSQGTSKQHKLLLGFIDKLGEIRFSQINYRFLTKFESFLKSTDNYRGGKLSRNYIALMLTLLRRYVKEATKQGYIKDNPFDSFTIKKESTEKVWLTLEEIGRLEALDLSTRRGKVEVYRDAFVFSCYTGLRFSDICSLDESSFKETPEGFRLLKTPQKTRRKGITVNLPLYSLFAGKPQQIIGIYPCGFGQLNNKSANEYLVEFAGLAEIDKDFRFHSARHSFGMNLLNLGVPIEAVKQLMGHSDISTTQIYSRMTTGTVDDILGSIF